MEYINREALVTELTSRFQALMDEYDLEDIGVYEEQGAEDEYYVGFTVRKEGEVYMINLPYTKNQQGELSVKEQDWTIQAENGELHGYRNLDDVFTAINEGKIN
jgi:hypothetical protein